jgi:hypothetical protein
MRMRLRRQACRDARRALTPYNCCLLVGSLPPAWAPHMCRLKCVTGCACQDVRDAVTRVRQVLAALGDCRSGLGVVKCADAVPRPRALRVSG